jgi:hypothetical protein
VIGVTRPATTALGEEHDRKASALDHLEEAVLLSVPHDALGPGEHRVVVGEDGAVRAVRADQFAVDAGGAGDQTVSGRALHEIVDGAASALCRDGETTVLDEAALVAQLGEILSRGATAGRVASSDHVATALVVDQPSAPKRFGEIGTHAVALLLGHLLSLGVRSSACSPPA